MTESNEGLLSGYRVLDLCGEVGQFCGKLMGDMGADVVKIEPPAGDAVRRHGPFYEDDPDPEKSLYWFALNTSKRGITLNLDDEAGRALFRRMAADADFVIESYEPGYLSERALGYDDLAGINPGLVMVSITPFGQTGPYRHFKGPDLVMWALGAGPNIRSWDSHDRPPFRISHHPQTYFHAGTEAVIGAMVAAIHRGATGEGQHVDVSVQECVNWHPTGDWDFNKRVPKRGEGFVAATTTHIWPCKDGFVMWRFAGGAGANRGSVPLVAWMADEDMADEWLQQFDWSTYAPGRMPAETIARIEEQAARFFGSHTKAELMAGAIDRRLMMYPVSTTADLLESPQLEARDFWQDVEHPELGTTLRYPGKWANNSETSPRISRRAPQLGEHNREIYLEELGLGAAELEKLQAAGTV